MSPQDAVNNLNMVLQHKVNMTGAENDAAKLSLKTLVDALVALSDEVQKLKAERVAPPVDEVPQSERDRFNGEAHP